MAESLWNYLTESRNCHRNNLQVLGNFLQTQICLAMCGQDSPQLFAQIWDFDNFWNFSEQRREVTSEWPPLIAATLCFRDWPGDNCHSIGNKMWPPPDQCDRWPIKLDHNQPVLRQSAKNVGTFFLRFVCNLFFGQASDGKWCMASDGKWWLTLPRSNFLRFMLNFGRKKTSFAKTDLKKKHVWKFLKYLQSFTKTKHRDRSQWLESFPRFSMCHLDGAVAGAGWRQAP